MFHAAMREVQLISKDGEVLAVCKLAPEDEPEVIVWRLRAFKPAAPKYYIECSVWFEGI